MSPLFRPIVIALVAATAAASVFWGLSLSGDSGRYNSPVHATYLAAAVASTVLAAVCWAVYVHHGQDQPGEPDWQAECMATVRTLASVAADHREQAKTMPLRRAPWQADFR